MPKVVIAKVRIERTPTIDETMRVYRESLQHAIDVAWNRRIKNRARLHPLVYKDLRTRGLPSQLAVSCITQAIPMVKGRKRKPVVKRARVRYNFPRSANLTANN